MVSGLPPAIVQIRRRTTAQTRRQRARNRAIPAFGHRQGDAATRTTGSQNNAYGRENRRRPPFRFERKGNGARWDYKEHATGQLLNSVISRVTQRHAQQVRRTTPMVSRLPPATVQIRRRTTARMRGQRARNPATLNSVISRVMQRHAQPVRKTTPTESRNRPRRTRSILPQRMTRTPRQLLSPGE